MAYLTASSSHSATETARGWLDTLRARLTTYLARRAVYRATVRELSALSNRELADIGIHRSAIRSLAKEHADAV